MYFTHNCRFSVPSIAIGHHLRQIVAQGIIADRFKCKKVFGKMEKKIVVVLIRRLHGWLTIQQAMSQATIKVFFVSSRLCFLHLKRTLYDWITIASLGIFVHQKNYYIFCCMQFWISWAWENIQTFPSLYKQFLLHIPEKILNIIYKNIRTKKGSSTYGRLLKAHNAR